MYALKKKLMTGDRHNYINEKQQIFISILLIICSN